VPAQLWRDKWTDFLLSLSQFTNYLLSTTVSSALILQFAGIVSLNFLWSLINAQQLAVHLPLFKVNMPANASYFYSSIISILNFDITRVQDFHAIVFNLEGLYES